MRIDTEKRLIEVEEEVNIVLAHGLKVWVGDYPIPALYVRERGKPDPRKGQEKKSKSPLAFVRRSLGF